MSDLPRLAECRSCHDPIRFVRMRDTGRALPVNPRPGADGNVSAHLVAGQLVGHVLSANRPPSPIDTYRFIAHYATCSAARPEGPAAEPTTTPAAAEPDAAPGLF